MITKEDVDHYLHEIYKTEELMEKNYKLMANEIKDTELIKIFDMLVKDEQMHEELVQELIDLLHKINNSK